MPDIECVIGDEPCTWVHDPFPVVATQAVIDICGSLSYQIDAGSLSIYISYSVTQHIIIFQCNSMAIVNQSFSYTISVYLTEYPDCSVCAGCCASVTSTIIIVSPCHTPQINVGVIVNIDFDFSGPTVWNPPPCAVTPPVCAPQIIYTCTYVSGPYTGGLDLCNYASVDVSISISFDISTGVFVFDSNDSTTFPPGVYIFMISIQIEATVVPVYFTMTIIAHCDVPTLTIMQ